MMSPNKRKIIVSDESEEEDSFKHRRSSLQVNLSYSTDLTDSGNGSLWKTKITNDERETNKSQVNRRLSKSKNIHKEKNYQSDLENNGLQAPSDTNKHVVNDRRKSLQIKEGIQLKRLTINLENINTKEKTLETNCKRLKDTILSKTKEMFDKQNELSIKTAMVLGSEKNNCISSTHELRNDAENKSIIMLDTINLKNKTSIIKHKQHIANNQQRENVCSDIIATPRSSDKQSSKRTVNKSRLSQRRLFVEPGKNVKQKCKIVEDIVLEKKFPLLSLGQVEPGNSPVLSGSNRRLSLLKTLSKSRSQSQFENLNNTYSAVQCDQSVNIGAPIVCSTFIEDNGIDGKRNKTVCEVDGDRDTFRTTHTINKVVSMEMTEINSREINQNVESIYIDTCVPVQPSIEKIEIIRKSYDTLQTHKPDSDTMKNERQCTSALSNSDNTIRSSLNVNTSIDAITTTNKAKNVQKSNKCRIKDINQDFTTITNNKEPVILENQHKTIDSVQTSLQMNTSVDSTCKTWRRKSNYLSEQSSDQDKNIDGLMGDHSNIDSRNLSASENKEEDVDSLENISLTERLRNISTQTQVSKSNNKKEITDTRFNNINKYQNSKRVSNNGDSYVEGTPYPISRSVLLKSQLRYKTQNMDNSTASGSNNMNSGTTEEDGDKTKLDTLYSKAVPNETPVSNKTLKTNEADTVILEDTPSGNPFVTQNTLTVIKDTPDEAAVKIQEKIITPQNTECNPVQKRRRKLLPLHESSQMCSFSPLEESKCISESPIKKNKILKKKRPKKKSADIKSKTSTKRNIANEEMWSDSDYDTFKNKKTEKKKTRKPKKVISKKIVIKKFAEENILNILKENTQGKKDQTIENIDSLDDFTKHRTISTQWNRYKSQKTIIVTTGLSKEDKNLVKSIIKSLGAAEMELNVSRRTTHVVSTGVRTINLLRGIITGCWLVTLEWVLKSLENNTWLDPEDFEMKHFSKAVQENRKDRQLFGPSYMPELFTTCGFIYVEHKTTVPCDKLKELIKTAGGHITENIKFAKIIIGGNSLKETWVIDSITTGELQLTKLYERE